jgi:hypothetical protein
MRNEDCGSESESNLLDTTHLLQNFRFAFVAAIPAADTPPDSRECSTSPPSSYGSSSPPSTHRFTAPRRPALGQEGRNIALRANHLEVSSNCPERQF